MRRPAALLALVAGLLVGASPGEDQARLFGIWSLVAAQENGREIPPQVIAKNSHQMIFEKTGYTDVFKGKKGTQVYRGVYRLDGSKTPKELDLATFVGKDLGPAYPAIYELKGDTLVICTQLDGKARPVQVTSINSAICTFKKQKAGR